jgi:peptidyl-prolyl cis-trans isomerase SurA
VLPRDLIRSPIRSPLIRRSRVGVMLLTGAALALASTFGRDAQATIVERVVAVVGDHPILLSELRSRAKPFEQTLPPAGSERATAVTQLYSQMLDRIVDEELIERAALQAQLKVSAEEVDSAIERVAKGNDVEPEALLKEVERGGITRAQYRIEIRRQLLDAKVMNLRLQGRLRISEEDVRREYSKALRQEREHLKFQAASIRISIGKTPEQERAAITLATQVAARARRGENFVELARTYSSESSADGGLMPSMLPNQLPKELQQSVLGLEVGEVSSVVRSGKHLVIVKLVERAPSSMPAFEKASGNIAQRVQLQKMERARRAWLDGLRRRTNVEVRL